MSATFTKFNITTLNWLEGFNGNLNSDTIMILLTNTAPNAGDTVVDTTTTPCTVKGVSNAQEIAAGNGYTKTGGAVGSNACSQTSGLAVLTGNVVVFTATGSVGPFRYAVLYNISAGTSSTRPLLGWVDYGSSVTLSNAQLFTIGNSNNGGNWTSTYPVLTLQ